MHAGTYATTDPNKRVEIVFDNVPPSEEGSYAPGVFEDLMDCFDSGNYYGAAELTRDQWARITEDEEGNVTLHDYEERWVETDSIWSCAGYDNPPVEIAKEFFHLTVTDKI